MLGQIILFFSDGYHLALMFFLAVVAIHLWYAFSIIYHLIRFGIGVAPKVMALIFFLGSVLFLIVVFYIFNTIDWQAVFDQICQFLSDIWALGY
jgi:uncharacterized paraquat-inducible protein A